MKKIFLLVLMLPLIVIAEDPSVTETKEGGTAKKPSTTGRVDEGFLAAPPSSTGKVDAEKDKPTQKEPSFPPEKIGAEGQSSTDKFIPGGARATAIGLNETPDCAMCKLPARIRRENKRTNAGESSSSSSSSSSSGNPVETEK